ncbi:MAG: hypothetical protein MJD61_16740 [Proteobacteria bacterium]|nr:hypothetical protein [Pseudomonadota bacterium]
MVGVDSGVRGHVSAPGKLMLSGEYVVLEGAEALVAAVERRVRATWEPDPAQQQPAQPLTPEAAAARAYAERRLGPLPEALSIDTSALYLGGSKLGLGSSAASAVAAAGAVFARHGLSLHDPEVRRQVLEAALAGHRSIAPLGSGADVVASTLGGVVRVRRAEGRPRGEPVAWPAGLEACVVWSGQPASTRILLERVTRAAEVAPAEHGRVMDRLGLAAATFSTAWRRGDHAALLDAVHAHAELLERLGRLADCSLMTPALRIIRTLAVQAGGAAKPSGAGGGDLAVAFFATRQAAQTFERGCRERGLQLVCAAPGAPGVSARSPRAAIG